MASSSQDLLTHGDPAVVAEPPAGDAEVELVEEELLVEEISIDGMCGVY